MGGVRISGPRHIAGGRKEAVQTIVIKLDEV